jgi:hypothetical protein
MVPVSEGDGSVTAGARFIARSALVRTSLAAAATLNFFYLMFAALYLLYAVRVLHIRPGLVGALLGGLLGSVVGLRPRAVGGDARRRGRVRAAAAYSPAALPATRGGRSGASLTRCRRAGRPGSSSTRSPG